MGNLYGVKAFLEYTVTNQTFYEEFVLRVKAESFEGAYSKAERYLQNQIDPDWKTETGEIVQTTCIGCTDCFRIEEDEEEDGVLPVYSRIFPVEHPSKKFLKALGYAGTPEELRPLRRK